MSIDKYRRILRDLWSLSTENVTSEMYTIARAAYQHHARWFGTPEDEGWKFEIVTGPFAAMARDRFRRIYIITILASEQQPEKHVRSIAHEMYHRVTNRRKPRGLHTHVWVDEMLAILAARKFLCEQGLRDYVENDVRRCYDQPNRLGICDLKLPRRRLGIVGLFVPFYPPYFGESIAVLGTTIEAIVGWEQMCRLTRCNSWQSWFEEIPESSRQEVREIIDE